MLFILDAKIAEGSSALDADKELNKNPEVTGSNPVKYKKYGSAVAQW